MEVRTICAIVTLALCVVPTYVSLYRGGDYSALSLLIIIPTFVLLFDMALIFGTFGIEGIRYVLAGASIAEMWMRLFDGASTVTGGLRYEFQDQIDEWLRQHG